MITINATKIIKDNFSTKIRAKYVLFSDLDLSGLSEKVKKGKFQTYICDFATRDEAVKYIIERCKLCNERMDRYGDSDEFLEYKISKSNKPNTMIPINAKQIIKDNFSQIRAKYIFVTDYNLAGQSRKIEKYKGQTYKCYFETRDEAVKYIVERCKMYNKEMDKDKYFYSDKRLEEDVREIISQKRNETIMEKNNKVIEKQTGKSAGVMMFESSIRLGENRTISSDWKYSYRNKNQVICEEEKDWKGYSKSFGFPMVVRSFEVCVKKGYTIHLIGGIVTYIKGNRIDRFGMPCEWVKQGRAISDLRTIKGYLVRGQHIEASSLEEAQKISEENRRKAIPAMLEARLKLKKRIEEKKEFERLWAEVEQKRAEEERMMAAMVTREITFEDSLNSGNCFPGTDSFKKRLEEEVGHPVDSINAQDLLSYATKYGLKSYALRTIKYVIGNK